MDFKLEISIKARKELLDAIDWYEQKQTGLGDRFASVVIGQINQINSSPFLYTQRNKHHREVKVNQFPYLIVYSVSKKKNMILIVSIFHSSRSTKSKYKA